MRVDPRLTHGEAIHRQSEGYEYEMRGGVLVERFVGRPQPHSRKAMPTRAKQKRMARHA